MWMFTAVMLAAAYLLGSISFGLLIGKWFLGIDIREYGSGNAGATNLSRVMGTGPGIVVLLLDGLKGFVPVWLTLKVTGQPTAAMLVGLAAIVGHIWPVYFRFKGGKGVATTIGVMLAMSFWATLIAGLLTVLIIAVSRYVSLGSLVFVSLMPWLLLFFDRGGMVFVMALALTVLVFWTHRENILRLLRGQENRFGKRLR